MAIKYVVRKATNPQDSSLECYNGRFKMEDRVNLEKLSNIISDQCSLTPSDVRGIISALLSQIKMAIVDSQIVRLGDFGSLRAEVSSTLSTTKKGFSKENLKGIKMVFTPGKQFKTACKGAQFKAAAEIKAEEEVTE